MNFKVLLNGEEIPRYVDHRLRLVDILMKLGLRAECVWRVEAIHTLGSFSVEATKS